MKLQTTRIVIIIIARNARVLREYTLPHIHGTHARVCEHALPRGTFLFAPAATLSHPMVMASGYLMGYHITHTARVWARGGHHIMGGARVCVYGSAYGYFRYTPCAMTSCSIMGYC